MTALTIADVYANELAPNSSLKELWFLCLATVDAGDTITFNLADFGMSATGLLFLEGWKHTTDGSICVIELFTCAVVTGTVTLTVPAGTDNDPRIMHFIGRATPGVFA